MTEILHGHVTSITEEIHGDEAAAAVPAGTATGIPVDDTCDFDETGGTVRINGTILTYTGVDDDVSPAQLILSAVNPIAIAEGDRLEVWSDSAGTVVSEWVAVIADDVDGSPIQATVSHALLDLLGDGVRGLVGESVTAIRDEDDQWWVTGVIGKTPILEATGSLTAGSDATVEIIEDAGRGTIRFTPSEEVTSPGLITVSDGSPGVSPAEMQIWSPADATFPHDANIYLSAGDTPNPIGANGGVVAARAQVILLVGEVGQPLAPHSERSRSSVQSLPNSTTTAVAWNQDTYDELAGNLAEIPYSSGVWTLPCKSGFMERYQISGTIVFAANATGRRVVNLVHNSTSYQLANLNATIATGVTAIPFVVTKKFADGDTISITVNQTSGGALDLTADSRVTVTHLG